jgi:hypothetical protein
MDMRQIIKLFLVLSLVLLASCSTQQRVVYRDCDCNNTTFGLNWNTNPYWGWNDPYWGYQPHLWGYNRWNSYPYRVIPRYYIPNRVQPTQPSRYERRQSIGSRPSRYSQNETQINNQYRGSDNIYPQRSQPSKVQNRVETPSRIQNNTPSRVDNVYQQRSQPSRVQNNTPSRVETPSRVQQRQNTPVTTQPTRSRVQNREN